MINLNDYTEFKGEKITICLTSFCNAKCQHCYIDYHGKWDINELRNIIPALRQKYKIALNGAEVLTNPDYLELYALAGEHNLLTNGLAIVNNPNLMKEMQKYGIDHVSISYHFGSTVSAIPSKTIEQAIKLLQANGFEVEIMTTISKENYKHIEAMCKKTHMLGVRELYLINYLCRGNAHLRSELSLSTSEIIEFIELLHKVRSHFPKDELYIERSGTFDSHDYLTKSTFECYAAHKEVAITPDKRIYPCIFCIDKPYQIGHLCNDQLLVSKTLIDKLPNMQGCMACNIYNKTTSFHKREFY